MTDSPRSAHAWGLATVTPDGTVLDVWYPEPLLGAPPETTTEPPALVAAARVDAIRGVETHVVHTEIADLDAPPTDAYDVYLRLHLLSHRLVRPHGQNLDGVFGLLNNVVWTTIGPCPVEGFEDVRARARAAGLTVSVT
ncbi:MAG: 2,3,4,5-tetrahydropyridine-2,6-dicarboxylate N-succinyltransferase, partial [Aeromicrobium sp.]